MKMLLSFLKMIHLDNVNIIHLNNIIYNAKLRNTSICGATETILLHKKIEKCSYIW